jgi:putative SOS response-associated peptidase YedK
MCGRFVQTSSAERLAERFAAFDTTDGGLQPRRNVAPATVIPAVIDAGQRRLGLLRWGFVPSWSRTPEAGPRPINARIEGAHDSRLFATALARQRCIVPLDAWYEWTDEDGARQPWLLQPRADAPVSAAALWSTWRSPDSARHERPLGTVALLTTEATGDAATIHHRMPLTVPDDSLDAWLDPSAPADTILIDTLRSTTIALDVIRVSRRVNDVRNDDPELLAPIGREQT